MDYRTVGSSALRVLDSDPPGHTHAAACLLRVGASQHTPEEGALDNAVLAYLPGTEAGVERGSLLALTTAGTDVLAEQSAAVLAAAEFVRAYHASLGQHAGQALRSAVGGTVRHMAALSHTSGAPDLAFAYAALQDRQVWIAARGAVCVYVLRGALGQWAALDLAQPATPRNPLAPTFYAPLSLETGDILLLLTRAIQERLTKRLIRRCLLGLVQHRPHIRAQCLADTLVRMAAVEGGAVPLAALVVRCHAVLAPTAARAYRWPAAYGAALRLPAAASWHLPPPDELTIPPPRTVGEHAAPRLRAVDYSAPPEVAAPVVTAPSPAVMAESAVVAPASPSVIEDLPTPPPAPPRRAPPVPALRAPHSVLALILTLAGGLGVSWLGGTLYYLLSAASLAGIIGLLTFWWRSFGRPGAPRPQGSAAGASQRLRGISRATAQAWPEPFALPVPPGGTEGAPRLLVPSKAVLALPQDQALQVGCLDIVSLRDSAGRIVAQVVLLCPAHLLAHPGAQPEGLIVLLHDLVEDRRSAMAWLAPRRAGALRAQTVQTLAAYGETPAPVRVAATGGGPLELMAGQAQVLLSVERCRFLERFRPRHLAAFQVRVVTAQARF